MKVLKNGNKEALKSSHRKSKGFSYAMKGIYFKKTFFEVVDLRFYSTGSRIYACLWIHKKGICISGSGYASGYGYCKEAKAFENALASAGIELDKRIYGMQDIESAVKALVGEKNSYVVRCYL